MLLRGVCGARRKGNDRFLLNHHLDFGWINTLRHRWPPVALTSVPVHEVGKHLVMVVTYLLAPGHGRLLPLLLPIQGGGRGDSELILCRLVPLRVGLDFVLLIYVVPILDDLRLAMFEVDHEVVVEQCIQILILNLIIFEVGQCVLINRILCQVPRYRTHRLGIVRGLSKGGHHVSVDLGPF